MSKSKRPTQVTEPVLTVKGSNGSIFQLWVLDVGQWCKFGKIEYRAATSASLIYVSKSGGMFYTEENYIDHKPTWEWVQKLVQKGMDDWKEEEVSDETRSNGPKRR